MNIFRLNIFRLPTCLVFVMCALVALFYKSILNIFFLKTQIKDSFRAELIFKYSSPPQLPQLNYFRSNAILNWVQKTRVKLFFPQFRYFFPPGPLFSPQLCYFLLFFPPVMLFSSVTTTTRIA